MGESGLLQIEATGETVGEAKWSALRELEKLQPGLDKSAVKFQVVSEGERGRLSRTAQGVLGCTRGEERRACGLDRATRRARAHDRGRAEGRAPAAEGVPRRDDRQRGD